MTTPTYPPVINAVDIVLFTLEEGILKVVLFKREKEPFLNHLALPGGYVHLNTDVDCLAAAYRTLETKTNIKSPYLEQLHTFSGKYRDPTAWSVSVAYFALVNSSVLERRKPENVLLVSVDDVPELAYDHNLIFEMALKRLRDKSSYSALPCYLLPQEFTLSELQNTYAQVLGTHIDKSSFRRKIEEMDFLEIIPDKFKAGKHRPAQLYRIRKDKGLFLFDRTM